MTLNLLKKSLEEAPIIKKGDYNYVVHPITDGVPEIHPDLLDEVADEMVRVGNFDCDRIITAEAMGIPLATAVSWRTRVPFCIIRKRSYGLEGEVPVSQVTGYSKSELFINGLKKGDRVTLVDDVLSTGGTLRAVLQALQHMGVILVDVIIAVEKTFGEEKYKASHREMIEKEFGVRIITLETF